MEVQTLPRQQKLFADKIEFINVESVIGSGYENEPDQFRALSMRQHLNGKLNKAKENAELWSETFPAWAEKLLVETQF